MGTVYDCYNLEFDSTKLKLVSVVAYWDSHDMDVVLKKSKRYASITNNLEYILVHVLYIGVQICLLHKKKFN